MTDQATGTNATPTPKAARKKIDHKPLSTLVPGGFVLQATQVTPDKILKKASNRKLPAHTDQDQKRVDADVKANAAKNQGKTTESAKDDGFAKLVLSQYIVPAKAVDTVLHMLDAATTTAGTAPGHQKVYRRGTHGSGNVQIQWAIVKKVKAPKPTSPVAPATSTTPTNPAADQEG